MARRQAEEDEYDEEEYEEEYEGHSVVDAFAGSDWRRTVVVPLILILFGFGMWMMWKRHRDDVFADIAYRLDPQKIKFTPPPEWIDRDILAEVFKLGSLDAKGILDEGVTVQVAGAFELHPWVKEVDRVRIVYPAQLHVALNYRTPIAMVLLPDDDSDKGRLMKPIDAHAVHLPWEDFNEELANDFPWVDVGNTYPMGPVGSIWGDDLVEKAAMIAEVLYDDWDNLKDVLYRVERSSQPTSTSDKPDFDIRGLPGPDGQPGLIVHWGRAPGDEQAVEPTARAKMKRLQQWVNDIKLTGMLPVGEIDLRSSRSMQDSMQAAKVLSVKAARQARQVDTGTVTR